MPEEVLYGAPEDGDGPKRSIGVTVSAVSVLIASLLCFLIGLLPIIFLPPSIPNPTFMRSVSIFVAVCSLVGALTAIDLFRRKRWARVSILIFSGILTYIGVTALASYMFFPPPEIEQNPAATMVAFLIAGLMLLFGLFLLLLFCKDSVKNQFPPAPISRRPTSIKVIIVVLLFGAVYYGYWAITGWPAIFFGFVIGGWAAVAVNLTLAVLSLYAGFGLFRLNEMARKMAVGYSVFGIINMISFLVPGFEARISSVLGKIPSHLVEGQTSVNAGLVWFCTFQAFILLAIQLWFLVTRRNLFAKPN